MSTLDIGYLTGNSYVLNDEIAAVIMYITEKTNKTKPFLEEKKGLAIVRQGWCPGK